MLIERIYDKDLAQAGYVIGCQRTGQALVVDARRGIDVYRDMAAKNGMEITAVTETRIHADHLSGTRELAAATGADSHVSGEGGEDRQDGFEAARPHDGDEIRIGNIVVAAVHTPGHTRWGPYLATDDEAGFVAELLDGQPDAPFYFGRMKNQNRRGPAVMGERAPLPELDPQQVAQRLAAGEVTFVDTRSADEVHTGTVTGALNIPAGKAIATYAAWAVNPGADPRPLVLLAPDQEAVQEFWDHLVRVGIDAVAGYVTGTEGVPQATPRLVSPEEVETFDKAVPLDVRAGSEHTAGHVPGSTQLHGGRVLWSLDRLPEQGTIVTYCQSGLRSSVVASTLRHAGYDVVELEGSYAARSAGQEVLEATPAG